MVFLFNEISESAAAISARVFIPRDFPHFDGHFDDHPIVPGASQIGMVVALIDRKLKRKVSLIELKRTKFTSVIPPETWLDINVNFSTEARLTAQWAITSDSGPCSKGTIFYE